MSVWRKKALECAPELRAEFEEPDLTIYTVFMELRPLLIQAHRDKDRDRQALIYDFADWCFHQPNNELHNEAAVSFYEHLLDASEPPQLSHNGYQRKLI